MEGQGLCPFVTLPVPTGTSLFLMRIGFQGEAGAFSEQAALQCVAEAVPIPCDTFDDLYRAIDLARADAIVAPVHNSIAGPVSASLKLLRRSSLWITAETKVLVRMQLIGVPGARVAEVKLVRSHPVALAQCRGLFARNPQIVSESAADTAGSVREIMQAGDASVAAIASERAAELYGAQVLMRDVHDVTENRTRFLLLQASRDCRVGANKLTGLAKSQDLSRIRALLEASGLTVSVTLEDAAGLDVLIDGCGEPEDVLRIRDGIFPAFRLLGTYREWQDATWT
ncbi:MAG: hypothetical protein NVS9B15_04900 [Acidobacteriaceae bacterium]